MYRIEIAKRARRQLVKLHPQAQARLESAIDRLQHWPVRGKLISKLKGPLAGLYRLRAGDYRAFFAVDEDSQRILVERVAHRKDAYK